MLSLSIPSMVHPQTWNFNKWVLSKEGIMMPLESLTVISLHNIWQPNLLLENPSQSPPKILLSLFFLNPCASNSYSLISPWLLFFIPLCAYDSFPNVVISLQICCLNISLKSRDLFPSIWRDSLEHIPKKTLQYLHLSFPFRVVAMYPWILSSQFMQ